MRAGCLKIPIEAQRKMNYKTPLTLFGPTYIRSAAIAVQGSKQDVTADGDADAVIDMSTATRVEEIDTDSTRGD